MFKPQFTINQRVFRVEGLKMIYIGTQFFDYDDSTMAEFFTHCERIMTTPDCKILSRRFDSLSEALLTRNIHPCDSYLNWIQRDYVNSVKDDDGNLYRVMTHVTLSA